jgi:hypothetical protein
MVTDRSYPYIANMLSGEGGFEVFSGELGRLSYIFLEGVEEYPE